ncbi:helix-turn-helix domain-containing protein [Agromyces sp. ISL-38]|uniref:helix-turn-helix domain-containing protein n=1 Tax=Agromyces sp. ISL-38 TaxID=2819107 RepID=UPI001BEAFFA9|nr:helix-turn-helix transcriptional regulator [Agromyces sp. ISL-38]MBT2498190.1 helix-turn-helix domain-containing protein [Agromyces sp. ISL-38]MBT2518660.1 helix-turn-helix domain-containing protein [Streptomyces sp. ISL-90]
MSRDEVHGSGLDRVDAAEIDVPGIVMRVRRICDLSQRDLGLALGLDQSQVARIESSRRRVDLLLLVKILALAEMRIAVLDRDGVEVVPVPKDVLRDNADRRMPAHLDVREPSDAPMSALLKPHSGRASPRGWYHHRAIRDRRRSAAGSHALNDQPTVSGVAEREGEQNAERLQHARRLAAALLEVECTCLDGCWESRGCTDDCACRCDP